MTIESFAYFGKKKAVAPIIWDRFGEVVRYIEPFCGSASVLLERPKPFAGTEVIGDNDLMVANFFRAIKHQPNEVARHAAQPATQVDLYGAHTWLQQPQVVERLICSMKDYHWEGDAKVAGIWYWGNFHSIGKNFAMDGKPYGKDLGGTPSLNISGKRPEDLIDKITQLYERLRTTVVVHGGWERTLWLDKGIDKNKIGVFLDPPYKGHEWVYAENTQIADDVAQWCKENEQVKICLAGHDGDYDLPGWDVIAWERRSGFWGSKRTADQERLWFSPGCEPTSQIGFF